MCLKINRDEFDINETVITDALVFMLRSYLLKDFRKFAFWRRQFNKAIKVDDGCYCDSIVIESND